MKLYRRFTILFLIFSIGLLSFLTACGGGGGGGGGSPSYTQEDLEGIWFTQNRYYFIDETGELVNAEPISTEIIYDYSGSFTVDNRNVTGTVDLDHQHTGSVIQHDHIINYSGLFVSSDEIDMDWDIPIADTGIENWQRVPYTGIIDLALIDSKNALILAQDVLLSGNIGIQMYIYYLTGKTINVVDSIQEGSCGGNKRLNGTIDALSGEFTGTLQYNDFCDDVRTDGFTMNGNAKTAGYTDLETNIGMNFINTFNGLTFVLGDQSFSINGRKVINRTISPHLVLLSYVFTDNNTVISYWLKDWILRHTHGEGYFEIVSAIGRFYDPDYGYVELSIEEGILTSADDYWPSSGKLVLTGAEGTQGGDTKVRLTFLSATEYLVEADTDGDGAFDDYNSGTLLWSDLL